MDNDFLDNSRSSFGSNNGNHPLRIWSRNLLATGICFSGKLYPKYFSSPYKPTSLKLYRRHLLPDPLTLLYFLPRLFYDHADRRNIYVLQFAPEIKNRPCSTFRLPFARKSFTFYLVQLLLLSGSTLLSEHRMLTNSLFWQICCK